MKLTKLQEIAKAKGKKLLIEEYTLSVRDKDIEVFEKPILIESTPGKKFKARAVLRNVPISRYTENLNKRVYGKNLWERVVKLKMGEGSGCLSGHPDDDGNPKDLVAVWHDLKIGDKTPTCDLYLIGDLGSKMLEAVEAGFKPGFSSVGFGQILSDGKTVDPESYELDRIGDWVLAPSQQVFGTLENLDTEYNNDVIGINESSISKNNNTNNKERINNNDNLNSDAEVNMMERIDKLQESNLKNKVRVAIKEAKLTTNFNEALKDLKDIKDIIPSEMGSTIDKIDEAIDFVQDKVEEYKVNLENENNSLKESLEKTKNDLEVITDAFNSLSEKTKKLEGIVDTIGVNEDDDITNLKEQYEINKENTEKMLKDIVKYEEEAVKKDKDIEKFKENFDKMNDDISHLLKERMDMEDDINQFKSYYKESVERIRTLESALIDNGFEVETFTSSAIDVLFEKDEEPMKDDDKDKDKDMKDAPEDDEKDMKNKDKKEEKVCKKEEMDNEQDEDDMEMDDEPEEEMGEKKKMKKESKEVVSKKASVIESFYTEIEKFNESVKDIKDEILKSETLEEAVSKYSSYKSKSKGDKVFKIKEGSTRKRPSFLGKHRI